VGKRYGRGKEGEEREMEKDGEVRIGGKGREQLWPPNFSS